MGSSVPVPLVQEFDDRVGHVAPVAAFDTPKRGYDVGEGRFV